MNTHKKATIMAGVFSILGVIAGIFSVVPVIEEPGYLDLIATHQNQVVSGAFFQFLMIPAYVGFALCLYPILKTKSEALSLGFVGFRLVAAAFHLIALISLSLFLTLSDQYIQAGEPETFHSFAEILRIGRDLINHAGMILASSMGDLLLFYLLYQSGLVPRWLSGWGLIGTVLAMFASLLILFQVTNVVTALYLGLNMPIALQGFIFAGWLIFKGFDAKAIKSESSRFVIG